MQLNAPWLKPAIWGAVVGSVATMIVGFSWEAMYLRTRSSHASGREMSRWSASICSSSAKLSCWGAFS